MKRGFTLIELLVVIVIIGILLGIALPNYAKAKDRAREAKVKSNISTINSALVLFGEKNNGYFPGISTVKYLNTSSGPVAVDWANNATDPDASVSNANACMGVIGGYMGGEDDSFTMMGNVYSMKDSAASKLLWDRLYVDSVLTHYPRNPFHGGKPMINVFHLQENAWIANGGTPDPGLYALVFPDSAGGNPHWYQPVNFNLITGSGRRDISSWPTNKTLFPAGDFAYIPFEPLVSYAEDPLHYMVFVRGYWIVGYGSKHFYTRNKEFLDDHPYFVSLPPPLGDGSNSSNTDYEATVRTALYGALIVKGNIYMDLINQLPSH